MNYMPNLINAIYGLLKYHLFGHIISKRGITIDPTEVDLVSMWLPPTSVTEVRSFMGFTRYYRIFIEGLLKIVKPLTRLMQKAVKFEWTDECQETSIY